MIKILGEIHSVETIVEGRGIRELSQLKLRYGSGNWRKRKGIAMAEAHWYEAHGIGKVKMKIKRWL